MRKTILIITLGLLLLISSCDNETSGKVSIPDWMYSEEVQTEADLIAAIKKGTTSDEVIVSIPSGTKIEVEDPIAVSGKVKLIIGGKAEITSTGTIFDISSTGTLTLEGKGTLDAGSQAAITSAGTLSIDDTAIKGTGTVLSVTGGTTTINSGTFTTTGSNIATISGSGTLSIPEGSRASFTVGTNGTVFASATGLDIKGGTYNVKLSPELCATGYLAQDVEGSDPARYAVQWSDARIVADIINGLSQANFQTDIKTIIDSVAAALGKEDDAPAGEGGTETGGTDEGENGGSTQPGTDTGTSSVALRESVANNTLTITGGTDGMPYTLTFDDYTHGFKDPKFATVVSGTAKLDINTTLNSDNTLDYAITCTDVTVEIDGHTVVINLSESTGKVEVSQSGTDFQLLIKYPDVTGEALKVKSDNGSQKTVAWADVDALLDEQASTSTGSGSTGN